MPLYGYQCSTCGPFDHRGDVSEASGASCPTCAEPAQRLFTAPLLRTVAPALSAAKDGADRTAHEPAVVSRPGRPHHDHGHAHGSRHAASGHPGPGRPWMIGH